LLLSVPALAQNTNAPAPPPASQQYQENASASWRASKIIGLNVYNNNNEKIGDINELMLDKQGNVELVVIGVGGFLGMGEHDVAVKFSELKWSDEPVRSNTTASSANKSAPATSGAAPARAQDNDQTMQTYPDHAVLNASKDQLKAMPEFNYSK
jgi:sporulation protein YlmC with PRC-barrel domain